MYKIFKILFILFITIVDIFCVFILFDEIRSKGIGAFDDASLLILVSLLILSIPAITFQYRTLRFFEARRLSEKNILDISLDEPIEGNSETKNIPSLIWLGNAAFGLEIFIVGILAAMIFLKNLSPNGAYVMNIRFILITGLLVMGFAIMLETWVSWSKYSNKT